MTGAIARREKRVRAAAAVVTQGGGCTPSGHTVFARARASPNSMVALRAIAKKSRKRASDKMSRLNRRVAVIAADRVAPRMAGAGIRASELARELGSDYEVVLVGPEGSSSTREDQPVQIYDPRRPETLKDACRTGD